MFFSVKNSLFGIFFNVCHKQIMSELDVKSFKLWIKVKIVLNPYFLVK